LFDIDAALRYVVKKERLRPPRQVDSPPMVSAAFVAPSGLLASERSTSEVSTRGWGPGHVPWMAKQMQTLAKAVVVTADACGFASLISEEGKSDG